MYEAFKARSRLANVPFEVIALSSITQTCAPDPAPDGEDMAMSPDNENEAFVEDLIAELAALNMAAMRALSAIALLSGDKRGYLSHILDVGLRDLEKTRYPNVRPERMEDFIEKARARYTDLIVGIRV